MKRFLNSWRGLVALAMLVALAGCTTAVQPVNLSAGVATLDCAQVVAVKATVSDLAAAPADSGRRKALKNWGLDPGNQDQIKKALSELDARAEVCKVAPSTSVSPSATGTPSGQACPDAYIQRFDANTSNRFYSDGVQSSAQDLEYLGHDARVLAFRAYAIAQVSEAKLVDTVDPAALLTADKSCLSPQGQTVYTEVRAILLSSIVDENGQAPADGYNSGMSNGSPTIARNPGISGDRSAVVYTLRNGNKIYIMKRCGNAVFIVKIINVPEGPTDQPEPSCPPGQHGTYPVCKDGGSVASSVGPTQVRGTEAPAGTASAPAVAKPTTANTPPPVPAPAPTTSAPRTVPPVEVPIPTATGTVGDG